MSSIIEALKDDEFPIALPVVPAGDLPRVYVQPKKPQFYRGRASIAPLVLSSQRALNREDFVGFGRTYSQLVNEFQPAIRWALSCWEYLLSTEGCKFILREIHERKWRRGDYRAFLESDYPQMIHHVFKNSLIDYFHQIKSLDFENYLLVHFWENVLHSYRDKDRPELPQQRKLTPYSYLRCSPYQFMNDHHHEKVMKLLCALADKERKAIEYYFLRFFTLDAAAQTLKLATPRFVALINATLKQLRGRDHLVFALLTQIERY